jgi:hypothetical protein
VGVYTGDKKVVGVFVRFSMRPSLMLPEPAVKASWRL